MAEVKLTDAPKGVQIFYDKGIAALERSNFDYAMDMFEAALKQEPRLLEVRKLLHLSTFKKNQNAPIGKMAALKNMSGLIKITSLQKKDPLLALESVEKILRNDPLNLKIAAIQCDCATVAGLPEVAIQTLELLKEHAPENLTVLEKLAGFYRQATQFEAEYECRKSIARLKPNDASAQKELKDTAARFTMDKSGWQKADSYRDVVKRNPPSKT